MEGLVDAVLGSVIGAPVQGKLSAKTCSLVSLQRYTKALCTLQRASLVEKSRQKPQERMKVLCEGACVTFPHLLCNFPPNRKERVLAICHLGGWYRGFGFRIQSKSIISII